MSFPSEALQQLIGDYIQASADALYIYDCIISFSQEINVIWDRKWSMTTWIYGCTRYISLVYSILTMISVPTYESCAIMLYILDVLQLLQFVCFAAFSALRVYALLQGKILIPLLIFVLNMIPFAVSIVDFATSIITIDSFTCTPISTLSDTLLLRLSLSSRIAVIIADALVLLVTWSKTLQIYMEARRCKTNLPVATLLVRDGTICFLILLILNVLQLLSFDIPSLFYMDLGDPFLSTLAPIIVCRTILNLRHLEPAGSTCSPTRSSTTLRFAGDIGEPLEIVTTGESDGYDYDEDHSELSDISAGIVESYPGAE